MMKILVSLLLIATCVVPVADVQDPDLAVPQTLKTNKSGRVRFEIHTNCKNVAYLVDSEDVDFDRVYTDPSQFQYKFSADKPGVYKVVFVAAKGDVPIIAQTVITYDGPPNPGPAPGPTPPVPPGPAPGPLARLYVVVIEETRDAKAGRAAYFADKNLLARIKDKKWALRVEDRDVKNAAGQTPPELAGYIKAASGKEPYVFLVNQDGKVLFEGVLPPTPADLLALIQKVGG